MFTILLTLRLADKVGEQDNKPKTLVYHFAQLRGYKMSWIKIWELVQSLIRMLRVETLGK